MLFPCPLYNLILYLFKGITILTYTQQYILKHNKNYIILIYTMAQSKRLLDFKKIGKMELYTGAYNVKQNK